MEGVIPSRDLRNADVTDTYESVPLYGEVNPALVCAGGWLVLVVLGLAN